jgi:F-type H+-transporting ATPase subunit delta
MTQRMSAARYARALFDVALAEDDPQAVEEQLTATLAVFRGHADLWRSLTNPAVPVQKKRAVVDELLPLLALRPVLGKLLQMLAGRDRLVLLPDMTEAYVARHLDHRKVVRADVTTAAPLAPERAAALEERLAAITGRTVQMRTSTKPEIIGGVVTQIGSTVYDGSIKRQLEKMRTRLQDAV